MEYIRKLHKYKPFHFVPKDPESGSKVIIDVIETFLRRLIGVSIFQREWNFLNFMFVFGITMLGIYLTCIFYSCYLYRHDITNLLFCVSTFGFGCQAMVKIFFFTIIRKRVIALNDSSSKHYIFTMHESGRVQGVICKNLSLIYIIIKGTIYVYFFFVLAAVFLPGFASLFITDTLLPFGFIIPILNPDSWTGYICNYIVQSIAAYYYYGISAGSDIGIIYNLLTASGQLDCMMMLIEELNDQLTEGVESTTIRQKIVKIIKLHQFHRDYLTELMHFLYLYHVGAIGFTVLTVMISVMGITDTLIETVGAIKWDKLSCSGMKHMNLVLALSQKPKLLMVVTTPLNISTYVQVHKMIYSMIMMLQNTK
ncbi:uncharacterized protein LOC125958113 [Anopheles darlingi]|uniref:uncharacterized protein LOC125958113 n=1 Tax=Anopheles darlingi TaxID=43151 RepID=UPI0021004689|nr:uncharacterized protein LOC125958113 [Anopheles darlingi]